MIDEALTSPLSPLGLQCGAVRNADIFRGLPIPVIDNARDIKNKSRGSSTFKNTLKTKDESVICIQDVSLGSNYDALNWSSEVLSLKLTGCENRESLQEC